MALCITLSAAVLHAQPPATFVQVTSDRYYTAGAVPLPYVAPFPKLPIARVTQVLTIGAASPTASAAATIALCSDNSLHLVGMNDGPVPTQPLGIQLAPNSVFGAYGELAAGPTLTIKILACSPHTGCVAFSCASAAPHACVSIPRSGLTRVLGEVIAVDAQDGQVAVVATRDAGLFYLNDWADDATVATWESFGHSVVGNVTAIAFSAEAASSERQLAVATNLAVYHSFNMTSRDFDRHELIGSAIDGVPTALAFTTEPAGASGGTEQLLWVGHEWCLNVIRADGTVDRVSGPQGLPVANITSLSAGNYLRDFDSLWVGSTAGVALRRPADATRAPLERRWRYFVGDAWLPGDDNVSVVGSLLEILPDSPSVLIATQSGLAFLSFNRTQTLEDKAATLLKRVPAHDRHLLVAATNLEQYGDASSHLAHDGDNDGLWTSMLVSSQIFRWQVTGDEEARAIAWKHFDAIEFLHNVTGTRGFIARTFVKCGEVHGSGDGGICPGAKKNTSCGWVNSTVCYLDSCCWVWKRDTSSDEVTGHIFGLLVAHQLLAQTDSERARVAHLLCDTVNYIVDGGFDFIDPISKQRTSWGYWSPSTLNGVPGKPDERGGNSLSMLGYLAAGALVCGDADRAKFSAAFTMLVEEEEYDTNSINAIATSPLSTAFFDFRLVSMAYQTILMAAPSLFVNGGGTAPPTLPLKPVIAMRVHANFRKSLMRYWNGSTVVHGEEVSDGTTVNGRSGTVSSLALLMNAVFGDGAGGDDASIVWQLERYPIEPLVNWPTWRVAADIDAGQGLNAARLDVSFNRDWMRASAVQGGPFKYATRILPADEGAWLGDSVTEASSMNVDGGDGRTENAPNPWLMVYWWHRYNNKTHEQKERRLLNVDVARKSPPQRTVMAFISTAVSNWPRLASYLGSGGEGAGTVNAISIDNLYSFNPRGNDAATLLKPNAGAIAEHKRLWIDSGYRTYPMLGGGGNITDLRFMWEAKTQAVLVTTLVAEAVKNDYTGWNIDIEPLTDVLNPDNNANARDGLAFADFLQLLGEELHAVNKTLSLDAMAVSGACWTAGGHLYPKRDLLPCPWIRRIWDLSALSAVTTLDKIISMDTYGMNSTGFEIDLQQYQYFFDVERFGVGLCPLGCHKIPSELPSESCIAGRIARAVEYGVNELDMWALWDSTASNFSTVEQAWRPFVQPLRAFLAGDDGANAESAGARPLCWNSAA